MHMWLMAARLRTLPAAVAPVLVGTAIAVTRDVFRPGAFIAALLGAILIQVGTNLSNDYSDARRGADTEDRLGPMRVTAGGLVPPRTVLLWTYLTFGAAVLCGVYLVAVAGWELLVLGVASILAGVLYTGGPRPYGYEGLGEVFVFGFFGLVAVAGSTFAQLEQWPWESFALAVPVGLLVTAILVVNNLRDIDTDRRAGKKTLAVRLGRDRARLEYTLLVVIAYLALLPAVAIEIADSDSWSALWWLLPWLLVIPAVKLIRVVRTHVDGPTLNAALARTAALQLVFCVLLAAGVLLS
jgi:1,4-dihydroxy-2-naphthoate polyprenyltransferase